MDSFEINKIIAAVLLIALIIIGIGKISDIAFHVDKPEKSAYKVEIQESSKESSLTIEKIRDKVKKRELFYDHFADQSSTNKWESNYKLKKVNLDLLPKFLVQNKNNYNEWFD